MKKSIYFHIDEVARDSIVAANLKVILKEHGINLVYGNRLHSRFLKRTNPFDAIILTGPFLVEPYFPDPDKIKVPIICLPTEGIGAIKCWNYQRLIIHFLGLNYLFIASRMRRQ